MEQHGDAVWTFVYASVRQSDLADDLTQDVFLRAFTGAASFRGESSARTWLLAIALNAIKDHARSAFSRRVRVTENVESYTDSIAGTGSSDGQLSELDIWQAVLQLKPAFRDVLLLRLREELSFTEIAAITGDSEGSLRVRYQRALKSLRKRWGKGDEADG